MMERLAMPLFGAIALMVLLLPPLLPYAPDQPDFTAPLLPPCPVHLFGTDELGRDVLSRVLSGGRVSLGVALTSIAAALLVGVPLGFGCGFAGGWFDRIAVRAIDLLLAFPSMLLALGLAATLGASVETVLIALFVMNTPVLARIARGQAMALRGLDFVVAARAIGRSDWGILARYVTPNALGPVLVEATGLMAGAMLTEATLSFLGLGIQPPQPSWGGMLRDATGFLAQAPWLAWFPGLLLSAAVCSINVFGDTLRDRLDPRIGPAA